MKQWLLAMVCVPVFAAFTICAYATEGASKTVETVGGGKLTVTATIPDTGIPSGYTVGVDDILDINILQPETLVSAVVVAMDGSISFPYIGNVQVKGLTLSQIKELIEVKLSEGYMKYPVVSVALRESRSKKFFVYGEVLKPGAYPMDDNMTVLKAISMAGGFTKYGSSSRVKVMKPKTGQPGYDNVKININAIMDGDAKSDVQVGQGDIIVVSEGVF
jgi:polysaccharide export outer membrane protein